MWRQRILFQSRLPRVYDANKSLGLGRSDNDRELGMKKTRKRRRIADSNIDKATKMRRIAGEDEVSDRISELPDSIIHHIFGFMRCTRDVARTTLLSKNWKRLFDSYQSFDFDQRWFRKYGVEQKKRFKEYVGDSLIKRIDRVERADKFRLYANDVDNSLWQCISFWICTAMVKNVRELDVCVDTRKNYELPTFLTQSSSIIFLKITGSSLHRLAAMKMCNLRRISIKESRVFDVNVMKKLEENCPLLEDLRIVHCPHLSHLEISSLVKLKRAEVQDCLGVKRIEIAAPNLETFWFHAKRKQKCSIDLKCKENLRNLTLKNRMMSDSAFEDCISMCPLLEKLELHKCTRIQKLRICSLTLKSLALVQCSKLDEIDVDASNLYSFQYEGRSMSFPLIKASRLSEVKFSFNSYDNRSNAKCENFIWNFDGYKGLKSIIYTKQNMKIFEDPTESDLFQITDCKIELTAHSSKVVKIVDNWLREFHGKSIVLVSSKGELLELINTLIIDREDSLSCCGVYSNKCWRHYMKDVKVSTLDSVEKTSFDMTWRTRKEVEQDSVASQRQKNHF